MKNNCISQLMALCIALFTFAMGCNAPATDTAAKVVEATKEMASKPDMTKVKAEIQALVSERAVATNRRDAATVLAFYADDAVNMPTNKPIVVGKAALEKDIRADFEKESQRQALPNSLLFGLLSLLFVGVVQAVYLVWQVQKDVPQQRNVTISDI